jgi:hypothetical protein
MSGSFISKILLVCLLLFAQVDHVVGQDRPVRPDSRRQKLANARAQIAGLKNGVLLVRLKTRQHTLAALRNGGSERLADRLEAEQSYQNRLMIASFQENFDFCPVLFFFSDQSEMILAQQLSQIRFVNGDLQEDTTIALTSTYFLTAEIATLVQDTTQYYAHEYLSGADHSRRIRYHGGPAMGFEALVIKSDQLIQLKRPFPYYVRTFSSLPFKRGIRKTVMRMNRQLHRYHEHVG